MGTGTLIAVAATAAATHQVDLVKTWATVWASVKHAGGYSQLSNVLTLVGTLLVLVSILRWIWSRRGSGHPHPHSHVLWTMAVGALLILPGVVVPALLTIADVVITAGIHLLG